MRIYYTFITIFYQGKNKKKKDTCVILAGKRERKRYIFYLFEENQPAVSFLAPFARSMRDESRPSSDRYARSSLARHPAAHFRLPPPHLSPTV